MRDNGVLVWAGAARVTAGDGLWDWLRRCYTPPPVPLQHAFGQDATPLFGRCPGSVSVLCQASGLPRDADDAAGAASFFAAARYNLLEILDLENGNHCPLKPSEAPSRTVAPETFGVTV